MRIKYPFPDSISKHADDLEKLTKSWLYNGYKCIPDSIKLKYERTFTGHLTARFFPFASFERLVPLSRSSLWGLAFDDFYEHSTPEQLHSLKRRIGAIIRGESTSHDENDLFTEMAIMAAEFRRFMPSYWMDRFARSMEDYIDGMAEEAPFKAQLKCPTVDEYTDIRWKSVDVLQMIDGLEVAMEEALPDFIREHPHMKKITKLTCRIIAWANDYFSVRKEDGRDVMNLIIVLRHNNQVSTDEAVEQAISIHNNDVTEYLQLCEKVPDFHQFNAAVDKFIRYNNFMIAGHWRWYIEDTFRYGDGGSPNADAFKALLF